MQVHAKIQKWGNGLALRISGVIRELPDLSEGTLVDIEVTETGFNLVKSKKKDKKTNFPFTEAQLLKDISAESAHADELADPLADEFE